MPPPGEHEFNCAFSTYDARDYVAPAESRWVAVFHGGREIPFTMATTATEADAERYVTRRLGIEWNFMEDIESVRREG